LAARIERASLAMRERNPKLPPILRTELNSACRQCEYAKMCQGLK
jgi:radical SAM protein with 4Fe4S-binding SPASM domain